MILIFCAASIVHAQVIEDEWKDGRQRPRNDSQSRMLVELRARNYKAEDLTRSATTIQPLPAQGTDATLEKKAEKPVEKSEEEKEEENSLPSFSSSPLVRQNVEVKPIPVSGATSLVASSGLPRIYAPGFRLLGLDVAPNFSAATSYNDNIFLRSGLPGFGKEGDLITTVSPSVSFQTQPFEEKILPEDATQFNLSINPSFLFFAEKDTQNSMNQYYSMNVGHRFSKLSFSVGQTYSSVSGGDIQAADLFNNDWYTTDASVSYSITPKTSFDLSSRLIVRTYPVGYDSYDGNVAGWVNYDLTPKVKVGIAPGVGWVDTTNGPNQFYQSASVRALYFYSEKTAFFLETGVQRRQYQDDVLTRFEVVFKGGASVQLAPKTMLELQASRREQNSNTFINQNIIVTGAAFTLKQWIHEKLTVTLNGNYDRSDYVASSPDTVATRIDDFFSISPGITYSPWDWCDWNFNYLFRKNLSTAATSEFENNAVSISSTVRF